MAEPFRCFLTNEPVSAIKVQTPNTREESKHPHDLRRKPTALGDAPATRSLVKLIVAVITAVDRVMICFARSLAKVNASCDWSAMMSSGGRVLSNVLE
jgi:hypothetical protein